MRICSIDYRERKHKARGYCGTHYLRLREHGHALSGGPERQKNGSCRSVASCEAKPKALGLCNKHHEQRKKYGDPEHGRTHTPRYEGKRIVTSRDGHVSVYLPNHPSAYKTTGYIPEHRPIMERVLGRQLRGWETGRHKNGVITDNTPENLELWLKGHLSGQRVTDLVDRARWIIDEYAGEEHKLR